MASLYNLSIKLSAEDAALFKELQESALLPTLATPGEGELVKVYKEEMRKKQEALMAPYADILEAELLRFLSERKDNILQQLREDKDKGFSVELFSWKAIEYYESLTDLKRRQSMMTKEQLREHTREVMTRQEYIEQNQLESTFGVERQEYDYCDEPTTFWAMYPVKVDRIFRFSDLATRLSLALGPNFFPYISYQYASPSYAAEREGYNAIKKTLCVRYYPFGVSKSQMDRLLACAKSEAKRKAEGQKSVLGWSEEAIGHKAMNIAPPVDEYADMPPLMSAARAAPPQIRLVDPDVRNHCFCGCAEDE
jgi:hypothetical protein